MRQGSAVFENRFSMRGGISYLVATGSNLDEFMASRWFVVLSSVNSPYSFGKARRRECQSLDLLLFISALTSHFPIFF